MHQNRRTKWFQQELNSLWVKLNLKLMLGMLREFAAVLLNCEAG